MKISQAKTNLQTIITNLSQLQTYRDGLTQDNFVIESEKIAKCKIDIEEAFNSLEQIDKVVTKLTQRKAKRIRRTKKIKALKAVAKSSKSITQFDSSCCTEIPEQRPRSAFLKQKAKDAKKYLSIMDSLQTLHNLRTGDDRCKLNESLNSIRSAWESTAQDIKRELQNPPSIDAQWRQVLFGDTSKAANECGFKEFVERRCVWDSFIVADDDPSGSCIPIGWVCPKEDAQSEWIKYRV